MTAENFQEIERKLGILINILAYQTTDGMTVTEAAPLLNKFGMKSAEIAVVLGRPVSTVSARITESKKKKK